MFGFFSSVIFPLVSAKQGREIEANQSWVSSVLARHDARHKYQDWIRQDGIIHFPEMLSICILDHSAIEFFILIGQNILQAVPAVIHIAGWY